jgi:hypothetical protein
MTPFWMTIAFTRPFVWYVGTGVEWTTAASAAGAASAVAATAADATATMRPARRAIHFPNMSNPPSGTGSRLNGTAAAGASKAGDFRYLTRWRSTSACCGSSAIPR